MRTRCGLVELDCGWSVAVGAARGVVVVTLQYDPERETPAHGVKTLRITADEAGELERAIADARSRATGD